MTYAIVDVKEKDWSIVRHDLEMATLLRDEIRTVARNSGAVTEAYR